MVRKKAIALTMAAIVIVVAVGLSYYEYTYYSPGGKFSIVENLTINESKTAVIIPSGTTIVINATDVGGRDGPLVTEYSPIHHSVTYALVVKGNNTLTGSWRSSGKSFLYVFNDSQPVIMMEPPYPYESHGVINETLSPGTYAIWIGGYVGDRISITNSFEASS